MKGLGRKPHTRILSFEKLEADKFICQHLNLSLGEAVFKLSRLRIADNEPLMVEDTYLPVKFFSYHSRINYYVANHYMIYFRKILSKPFV